MRKLKISFGFLLAMLIAGCSQSHREQMAAYEEVAVDEMIPYEESSPMSSESAFSLNASSWYAHSEEKTKQSGNNFISSSAAVVTAKDSTRRFIRTADLKFKVKSVIKSTYDIENIAVRNGGFVSFTNLTSNVNYVTTNAISADSILETTYYTVLNSIVLRVPSAKLDTTLKEISRNIEYLDHRIIKANDVALQLLANDLAQKRAAKSEQRLANAIDNRGRKLNETVDAEQLLSRQQERADDAKIANLSIEDQINFSTVNLLIYQRQTLKREMLANDKSIAEYEPSLWSKLVDAAISGWNILVAILVFLVNIWALLLIAVLAFVLFKLYKHKFKQ